MARRRNQPPADDDQSGGGGDPPLDPNDFSHVGEPPDMEGDEGGGTPGGAAGGGEDQAGQPGGAGGADAQQAGAAAAQRQAELTGLRLLLKNRGLEQYAQADDDEGAFNQLLSDLRTRDEQQQAEYRRREAYYQQQLDDFRRQQQAQAEQARASQEARQQAERKPKVQVPEWDPQWETILRDEQGLIRTDHPLYAKYHARKTWERDRLQTLLDPERFEAHARELGFLSRDEAVQLATEKIQGEIQRELEVRDWQNWHRSNVGWMSAQQDAQGRPILDQQGWPVQWSDAGQRWLHAYQQMTFAPEGALRAQLAFDAVRASYVDVVLQGQQQQGQQQQGGKPGATKTTRDRDRQFLRQGARRQSSRTGTQPQPQFAHAPPQNPLLNFRQALAANLDAGGITDEDIDRSLAG